MSLVNLVKEKKEGYLDAVLEKIKSKKDIWKLLEKIGTSDNALLELLINNNFDVLSSIEEEEWMEYIPSKNASKIVLDYLKENASSKMVNMIKTKGEKIITLPVQKKEENPKFIEKKFKVSPYPYQREHIDRIKKILEKNMAYVDSSFMGFGKTVATFFVAQELGLKLFIICPASIIGVWESHEEKMGMPGIIEEIVSYDSFKGRKYFSEGELLGNVKKTFKKNKILLVLDEADKIKNIEAERTRSVMTLIDYIMEKNLSSKVAIIGATLEDKEPNIRSMVKLTGIMKSDNIVEYNGSIFESDIGFQEIIDRAKDIEKNTGSKMLDKLLKEHGKSIKKKDIILTTFKIMQNIIIPTMRSQMVNEKMEKGEKLGKVTHTFCKVYGDDYQIYKAALEHLNRQISSDEKGRDFISEFSKSLQELEGLKLPVLATLAKNILTTQKNKKVLIFVEYLDSIEYLKKELKKFRPLTLTGSVKAEDRTDIVDMFQEDTDDHRLIILTTKTGGAGISFDDKTGKFGRISLYSGCTYSYISIKQGFWRTIRADSVTMGEVRVVYMYDGDDQENKDNVLRESKILDKWYEKAKVIDSISGRDQEMEFDITEEFL